jgi:hypothetical protein
VATGSTSVPVPIERGEHDEGAKEVPEPELLPLHVRGGYVPGACESELVANRNAGDFRVMTRVPMHVLTTSSLCLALERWHSPIRHTIARSVSD